MLLHPQEKQALMSHFYEVEAPYWNVTPRTHRKFIRHIERLANVAIEAIEEARINAFEESANMVANESKAGDKSRYAHLIRKQAVHSRMKRDYIDARN